MNRKSLSAVLFVAGLSLLTSSVGLAAEYPLEQKLQQCDQAFAQSRDSGATREQAAKARVKHLKLMAEILQNLNDENGRAAANGKPLSVEQLSKNVRVLGHLNEMLVNYHLAPSYDWSYVY